MPEARAIRLGDLALARLEAALHLVDHIDPALAADQTVGAMPAAQRFQRVTDFHFEILMVSKGRARQAEVSAMMGFAPNPADASRDGAVSRPSQPQMSIRTGR